MEENELSIKNKINANKALLMAFNLEIYKLVIQKRVSDRFPDDENEKGISTEIKKNLEKLEFKVAYIHEFISELERELQKPKLEN